MDMTRLSDSGWDENRVNLLMVKAIDVVCRGLDYDLDRKSTRLNSSHTDISRMPSSA